MTRSLLPALLLTLTSALPLAAQQVGHLPSSSPYEDLRGKQSVTLGVGGVLAANDPAGVGPSSSPMAFGRYDVRIGGPAWLITRLAFAPSVERTVKDPTKVGAAQIVGTDTDPLLIGTVGLGINLTGNKAWKRVAPQLHGAVGLASNFNSAYDAGGYRFGTKFAFSYGLSTRYVTRSKWELTADATAMLWQMQYPNAYRGDGSANDNSILGRRPTAPWTTNLLLSVGVTRFFFR